MPSPFNLREVRLHLIALVISAIVPITVYIIAWYLITSRDPLRYLSTQFESSLCVRRMMNADKRTWKGNARDETWWWWAVPSNLNKTEQTGFQDFLKLKAEVDRYKQGIEQLSLKFRDRYNDCRTILAWQLFYIGTVFYAPDDETFPKNAYQLALKLANTNASIFSIDGPTEDEYTIAWFAAYDLFGYPLADPKGEPLYPDRDRLLNRRRVGALVGGAIAGAVLAPVLLSAAGFTAAGVTAGSVAAGFQSAIYGGATTGAFSLLQSAGTGAFGSLMTVMGGAAAVGGGLASGVMSDSSEKEDR